MKFKSYLTTALLLASATFAKAQKADTAQAIVHYKFSHIRDTTKRDTPYVENMVLLIGRNASVYKSYDYKMRQDQMRKSFTEQINSGSTNLNFKAAGSLGTANELFQFPNEKKFVSKEVVGNSYLIEEAMPAMSWKISADTANFSGLQCQKATTHFKGRDYTAWFCPDLPYRAGPWKLNGLPGLIVEAYDTKKEVIFKFDGLDKVDPNAAAPAADAPVSTPGRTIVFGGTDDGAKNANVIALPKNGIKATTKEVNDLRELRRKDPQAFMQMQMAAMQAQMGGNTVIRSSATFGSGGSSAAGGITSVNVQGPGINAKAAVINNPLELPEKK
jgi:GLPGLI family protein